ncbi:MAG: molybdenum cofactor guanylyltransferase [Acidobacteriota bacterium]|nr:molybdenum cofactor guanylyltransferase [Acidobacteriota bacterium]MDH3786030.1 molybdenum cofactor guanylyltransferase [Acidobacteriota bacterium]
MIGVVLAGGRGERLGQPKADLILDGRTLTQRSAETLWPRCQDVLVSVQAGQEVAATFTTVPDEGPAGCGPLAGIAACFDVSGQSDLLVLACDYPRVDGAFLDRLLEQARPDASVVFPTDQKGRDHPLVAIWRRDAAAIVQAAVDETRYKVRSILRELEVQRIAISTLQPQRDDILLNVNHPQDWQQVT